MPRIKLIIKSKTFHIQYVHVPYELNIVEGSLLIMKIVFILSTCFVFFRTFTSTLVRYCLHNHINTNKQYLHLLLPSEHDRIKSTKTKTDATSQLCKQSQSAVIVSDRYIKDEK